MEGGAMFINLIAPINPLGYGVCGFNILKALSQAGHTVSYFPIGNPDMSGYESDVGLVKKTINNGHFYNKDAPCIRLCLQVLQIENVKL